MVFKERLREFLETSDTGRQAMAMSGSKPSEREQYRYETPPIPFLCPRRMNVLTSENRMDTLNSEGKKNASAAVDDDEDI